MMWAKGAFWLLGSLALTTALPKFLSLESSAPGRHSFEGTKVSYDHATSGLDSRANKPTLRQLGPGVTIFWDAAGKMRVFALANLPENLKASFGGNWDIVAEKFYSHCQGKLKNSANDVIKDMLLSSTDWTGIWQGSLTDTTSGSLGLSVDARSYVIRKGLAGFQTFVGGMESYWSSAGLQVWVNQVDDAWSGTGNPNAFPGKRDVDGSLEKRQPQCSDQMDLRAYLVNAIPPTYPDTWSAC